LSPLTLLFSAGIIILFAVILIVFPKDFIDVANAGLKPNSWRRVKLDVAGTRAVGIILLALVVAGATVGLWPR
jgi:hypothetical protein